MATVIKQRFSDALSKCVESTGLPEVLCIPLLPEMGLVDEKEFVWVVHMAAERIAASLGVKRLVRDVFVFRLKGGRIARMVREVAQACLASRS